MSGRSLLGRLREIHGPDVEITLVGRSDRARHAAHTVGAAPSDRSTAKTVLNGFALALLGIQVLALLGLVMLFLLGVLTGLVYFGFSAFGAPEWLVWSAVVVTDLFALALMWVNRK